MGVPGSANLLLLAGGGYQIERSLRFNSADSAYLSRLGWSGNRRLQTFSLWVKRSALGSRQTLFGGTNSSGLYGLYFEFDANDALLIGDYSTSWVWQLNTTARYRDPSAWYHIVFAVDTANATASNRARLYVNGVEVTAFSTASYMSQNYDMYWSYVSYTVAIGRLGENSSQYFNGYITEINFIDGQALTPSSFGETDTITGVWKPKRYAGTYGTNGFYLKFADNSGTTSTTLGKDSSGNGNNWTPNNFSVTAGSGNDSMIDVPTPYADGGNGRGNYCTINPLDAPTNGSFTISDGNLRTESTSTANRNHARSTIGVRTGKWYWEITVVSGDRCQAGVALNNSNNNEFVGYDASGWGIYQLDGNKYNNQGGTSGTAYGSAWTTAGDVLMVALDATNSKLWFGKNGTWFASGDPAAGTNAAFTNVTGGELMPAIGDGSGGGVYAAYANFGQRSFSYTPPSGFLALNTQNLPEPTIKNALTVFDATTWTGTGASLAVNTSGKFQPDLVWIKGRSGATSHRLTDSVRGVTNALSSDSPSSNTIVDTQGLTAFNSGGFTVGSNTTYNASGSTYIAWQWKKGASQGFDISSVFTSTGSAQTVSHSLGVAPSMIILFSTGGNWINPRVYHTGLSAGNVLQLSTTAAQFSEPATFASINSASFQTTQTNGQSNVAYLFSEVAGFSKFGSYTGNGSSDGPFVFCNFRPRFVMVKRTDSTGGWWIRDAARSSYNVTAEYLGAHSSSAEASSTFADFTSNGFKLGTTDAGENASGGTYVFAAFAEFPAKYSLAR